MPLRNGGAHYLHQLGNSSRYCGVHRRAKAVPSDLESNGHVVKVNLGRVSALVVITSLEVARRSVKLESRDGCCSFAIETNKQGVLLVPDLIGEACAGGDPTNVKDFLINVIY